MTQYLILSVAILVTAVLLYLVVHYHQRLKDADDPKFLLIIGILLVVAADTWISVYGQNVRAFFSQYHFLLSLIPLAIYGVYLLFTRRAREQKRQKERIKQAFSRYVIPDVIDEILDDPSKLSLGGQKRRLAILFSDIRSFTTISEGMDPEELVRFLNYYLTRVSQVILDQRGAIDKYIGDAVMAFWGAPVDEDESSVRACRAALAMQEEIARMQKSAEWERNGWPDVSAGIGINAGDVVVGNVGSEERFDYTALGDHVNLASRLEGLTKVYGVDVLVTEGVVDDLDEEFSVRELDTVTVKGKTEGVAVYELLSEKGAKKRKGAIAAYEKGLAKYREQDFSDAKKWFKEAGDAAGKLMMRRCDELSGKDLPGDWSGSYEMTTK